MTISHKDRPSKYRWIYDSDTVDAPSSAGPPRDLRYKLDDVPPVTTRQATPDDLRKFRRTRAKDRLPTPWANTGTDRTDTP